MMITYQDFLESTDKAVFIMKAINNYRMSEFFRIACDADAYDRQMNTTINNYVRTILTLIGAPVEDFTVSNNKIASNLFHRLNTQRCVYSLGNGITFADNNDLKKRLGQRFDTDLKKAGYYSLIHGVSYGFWNVDRLFVFPATEFVPLWDENDGTLMAGIRFWRLSYDKPMTAILYEIDGYTKYRSEGGGDSMSFNIVESKRPYKTKVAYVPATGEEAVINIENYSRLPIVPLWGNAMHQSTLVGMKQAIDSYDLIRSGFANDLTDCSQIYWIIENCGGMSDADLARFRDRIKINHIAEIDGDAGSKATPYTQEIPYQARKVYLDDIKAGIYEDFGGLDVHTIAAGSTNDHIDAAYQPMDENADDFEYQVIEFVQQILALMGEDEDTPVFKRNRVSNQAEQTTMVLQSASYLDDETVLAHLPFISADEVQRIMDRRDTESYNTVKDINLLEGEEEGDGYAENEATEE